MDEYCKLFGPAEVRFGQDLHQGALVEDDAASGPDEGAVGGQVVLNRCGRDIDKLIEEFSVIAGKYGADYDDSSFAGAGRMFLVASSFGVILDIVKDVEGVCKVNHGNMSVQMRVNYLRNAEPFLSVTISVPGKVL